MKNSCNLLFIATQPFESNNGVTMKILAQIEALEKVVNKVDLLYIKKGECAYYLNDNIFFDFKKVRSLYFSSSFYDCVINYIKKSHIDILYVRYFFNSCFPFNKFLRQCKRNGCKVIVELPTYPYDSEVLHSWKDKVLFNLERYFRRYLYKGVDRIVTYTALDKIYDIKTIKISNAPASIPPLHKIRKSNDFVMIAVANFYFWHGYDRLIKGLANYIHKSNKENIHLYMVGKGNPDVEKELHAIVRENNLENYVSFTGGMSGTNLDCLFDKSDFAIGCLGCHRKHVTEVKSLKNVEYAMRGIPFVYSEINPDFEGKDYVLKVPADDTDIEIDSIISFYRNLIITPEQIRKTVSDLTWDNQMLKVLQEIS